MGKYCLRAVVIFVVSWLVRGVLVVLYSRFPRSGVDWREVLRELQSRARIVPVHLLENIIGSMTTYPHPLGVEAFRLFWHANANDPLVFREIAKLESEVVSMLGDLLGGDPARVEGMITSGGSEANVSALYLAREHGYDTVYIPLNVHESIVKAARFLRMNTVRVGLNSNYKISLEDLVEKLEKHGGGVIVATAGSTGLGLVDPIPEVSKIALEYESIVHVDAAYGGFIVPFLKAMGAPLPDIGFTNEAVVSVTIDPHKMGLAPIPAGGLVARSREWFEPLLFDSSYLPMGYQKGLFGTRTGGSIAATWAVIKSLGFDGYLNIVSECMSNAIFLAGFVDYSPRLELAARPETPIVCIKPKGVEAKRVLGELWRRKWYPYHCGIVDGVRVVVMPHITREKLQEFAQVLDEVVGSLQASST